MSFKVVRVNGVAVAFGPNEDFYEPGMAYVIEDDAPTLPLSPRELLAKLDADNALTQRNLREVILLMAEGFKQATGGALDLSQVRGVAIVAAVEAQAEALRAQL
jgi:hypothetical protein